jgi:hypothetical protein
MNICKSLLKRIARASGLCTITVALALSAAPGQALDLSGLITVNGTPTDNVLVAIYNCVDGAFLGAVRTGPLEVINGLPRNYSISATAADVRIELYYATAPDQTLDQQCRAFIHCGEVLNNNGTAVANFNMACAIAVGVSSPEFWKTHPDEWPVASLTIGGVLLTKQQIISILSVPDRSDKSRTLFRQVVAAKLNELVGNEDSCIADAIIAADAWLARNRVGSGVKSTSAVWKAINTVSTLLEAYNTGLLCAPARVPILTTTIP